MPDVDETGSEAGTTHACPCCGCWNDHNGLCAACWTHQRDGVPCDQTSLMAQAEPDGWPDGMEMIRQARDALGLFAGAMPITPQQAWDEALQRARGLSQGRCWKCMDKDAGRDDDD